MVHTVWILIGLNTLLFLAATWEASLGKSDAAGKGMASGFATLIGIGLGISIVLILVSHHPGVLFLSALFSCGPILILAYFIFLSISRAKASNSTPPATETCFSSEKRIAP